MNTQEYDTETLAWVRVQLAKYEAKGAPEESLEELRHMVRDAEERVAQHEKKD